MSDPTPTANENQLIESYLSSLPLSWPVRPRHLMMISFFAPIGSGKTTVAQMLGKVLKLPVVSNDEFRRFLNNQGLSGDNPRPDLSILAANLRTARLLDAGVSFIHDGDLTDTYERVKSLAESHGGELVAIEIKCPVPELERRLRARAEAANGLSTAGVEDLHVQLKRHSVLAKRPQPAFIIDSSHSQEHQVHDIELALQRRGWL